MSHAADWKLPPYENTPEWWAEHDRWRAAYNTCGECGSTKLIRSNYDMMWHEADLHCHNGHFVRHWDAG